MGTFACELDATACSFTLACDRDACGGSARGVLDTSGGGALLIAARDTVEDNRLVAYRCAADGTACVRSLAPGAGRPAGSGEEPWPLVDTAANKAVLFTSTNESGARNGHLLATRCSLDLTACDASEDLSGNVAPQAALQIAAVRLPDGKLAVAAGSITPGTAQPNLVLHVTDGTFAGTTRTFANTTAGTGLAPSIAVDTKSQRIVIGSQDATRGNRLLLTRCRYDGTACGSVELGGASPAQSGLTPSVAVDEDNEKILVVSQDASNVGKPLLTRCNLDGSACRTIDLSAGQGNQSGELPSVTLDPVNGYLVAVTRNAGRPAVFRWGI
jgi:hypothetical protein